MVFVMIAFSPFNDSVLIASPCCGTYGPEHPSRNVWAATLAPRLRLATQAAYGEGRYVAQRLHRGSGLRLNLHAAENRREEACRGSRANPGADLPFLLRVLQEGGWCRLPNPSTPSATFPPSPALPAPP